MSVIDSPRAKPLIAAGWLVFATINAVLMYALPGGETIPYHLIWASFALLYGLAEWSPTTTWLVFATITVVTGIAILRSASLGIIGWEEASEIVLMGVIAALLIWHVNRHQSAQRNIAELHEAERVRAGNRDLATRFGSHELRTRLTIARGFTDLIRSQATDDRVRHDAELILSELDKASSLATNLMNFVRVDSSSSLDWLDIDAMIDQIVQRWTARVDRAWVVHPSAGSVLANAERFEVALDCLIENAVKFTEDGDRIGVNAHREGGDVVLVVADSGAGIAPDDLDRVTEIFQTGTGVGGRAGSGLGLAIVGAAVAARGGTLTIESELGSDTAVTIRFPSAVRRPIDRRLDEGVTSTGTRIARTF